MPGPVPERRENVRRRNLDEDKLPIATAEAHGVTEWHGQSPDAERVDKLCATSTAVRWDLP